MTSDQSQRRAERDDDGRVNVHVHADPAVAVLSTEILNKLTQVLATLDRVLAQGAVLMAKYNDIKAVMDAIKSNTDGEAAENQAQTVALDALAVAIADLRAQILNGNKGLTEDEADLVLNDLASMNATVTAIRERELAQTTRLTALGTAEVIPPPVDPAPVEPEPPVV